MCSHPHNLIHISQIGRGIIRLDGLLMLIDATGCAKVQICEDACAVQRWLCWPLTAVKVIVLRCAITTGAANTQRRCWNNLSSCASTQSCWCQARDHFVCQQPRSAFLEYRYNRVRCCPNQHSKMSRPQILSRSQQRNISGKFRVCEQGWHPKCWRWWWNTSSSPVKKLMILQGSWTTAEVTTPVGTPVAWWFRFGNWSMRPFCPAGCILQLADPQERGKRAEQCVRAVAGVSWASR